MNILNKFLIKIMGKLPSFILTKKAKFILDNYKDLKKINGKYSENERKIEKFELDLKKIQFNLSFTYENYDKIYDSLIKRFYKNSTHSHILSLKDNAKKIDGSSSTNIGYIFHNSIEKNSSNVYASFTSNIPIYIEKIHVKAHQISASFSILQLDVSLTENFIEKLIEGLYLEDNVIIENNNFFPWNLFKDVVMYNLSSSDIFDKRLSKVKEEIIKSLFKFFNLSENNFLSISTLNHFSITYEKDENIKKLIERNLNYLNIFSIHSFGTDCFYNNSMCLNMSSINSQSILIKAKTNIGENEYYDLEVDKFLGKLGVIIASQNISENYKRALEVMKIGVVKTNSKDLVLIKKLKYEVERFFYENGYGSNLFYLYEIDSFNLGRNDKVLGYKNYTKSCIESLKYHEYILKENVNSVSSYADQIVAVENMKFNTNIQVLVFILAFLTLLATILGISKDRWSYIFEIVFNVLG